MAAYAVAWVAIFGYVWSLWSRLAKVEREIAEVSRRIDAGAPPLMGDMTSAHFIFIPSVLLVGIVIGWILGSARRARRICDGVEEAGREKEESVGS